MRLSSRASIQRGRAPQIVPSDIRMRSGSERSPPLNVNGDVISIRLLNRNPVIERIRSKYGEMYRQRHVDRVKNQLKHRNELSGNETESRLFQPVSDSITLMFLQ